MSKFIKVRIEVATFNEFNYVIINADYILSVTKRPGTNFASMVFDNNIIVDTLETFDHIDLQLGSKYVQM